METRQIIEGKLLEVGKEPYNVQIKLEIREEDAEFILLRDVDGAFLEIEPPMKEILESDLGGGEEPEAAGETAAELESLCTALAEAKSLNELANESVTIG